MSAIQSQVRARRSAKLVIWLAFESLAASAMAGVTVGHEVGWLAGIVAATACLWVLLGWVHRKQVDRLLGRAELGGQA
jgi:hypothetical protein